MQTTRLDLDDYNNESDQGLHITSMPGSWLAIVRGFAGMQVLHCRPSFSPVIPHPWKSYAFKVNYQARTLQIQVQRDAVHITLIAGEGLTIRVYDQEYELSLHEELTLPMLGIS